mgnify:CR=1 FL=1
MMTSTRNERIRVLHVDDEPDFAELTAEFLEQEDERMVVLTAECPDDGLSILQDREIDCVVSDYDMPDADGLWFETQVRMEEPNLPFILYTAHEREELPQTIESEKPVDYMQKQCGTNQFSTLANRVADAVESE